jgi:ElaB/YqjD/DUF883 family membrane-anchored ribosome-binding protein
MANQDNRSTQNNPANGKDTDPMPVVFSDKNDAGNGVENTKDTASSLLSQAKSTAGEAYDKVAEKATSTIEEKKAGLTGSLTSVADSIRQVGDNLNRSTDTGAVTEYSKQYANTAAEKLESVARYFDNKDLKAIARDAESFARRNPAIFLGGAFALGILAARFFKSSPTPSIGQGATAPDHQLTEGTFAAGQSGGPRGETY